MDRLEGLRKKANQLPRTPGVYLMKDRGGVIIYVGKAKALRNRVSQYFTALHRQDTKVRSMVEHVENFDYILTDSEFEALVLECSLIKQYQPKYNILLKDDKGYHYIKVTKGEYPRIQAVKQRQEDGSEYIGPFTSSYTVTSAVDEVLKIFKLPQCSRVFPRDLGAKRPCLNYHIQQCAGVCIGKMSHADYLEAVESAVEFLKNGSGLVAAMKQQMEQAAENLEFEKAAKLRDRMSAIQRLKEKQKVVSVRYEEQDVFALATCMGRSCLEVFRFHDGRLADREFFLLEEVEELPTARSELITQYYTLRERIPPVVALDGEVEDAELLSRWLSEKRGSKVSLQFPQRGEQASLCKMCRANAAEHLAQQIGREGRELSALQELSQLLGLEQPPRYIESYDISHTAGREGVAGMVVFENGRPLKSAYKKFTLREAAGGDDYDAMREVLERRFSRYSQQTEEDDGFRRLPDLILMDGGVGQVNAVLPILKKYGITTPVFGMVKDGSHRTRAITRQGEEISITSQRQAYTLISSIQEEVHRFAIGFHRQKRKKNLLLSTLTDIDGVGSIKAKALLQFFGGIDSIRQASSEELGKVKGIHQGLAENIYRHFHPSQQEEDGIEVALSKER